MVDPHSRQQTNFLSTWGQLDLASLSTQVEVFLGKEGRGEPHAPLTGAAHVLEDSLMCFSKMVKPGPGVPTDSG